jgi:hypothetical protein
MVVQKCFAAFAFERITILIKRKLFVVDGKCKMGNLEKRSFVQLIPKVVGRTLRASRWSNSS